MKSSTRNVLILSFLTSTFLLSGAGIFHVLERPDARESLAAELESTAALEKMRTNLSVNITKQEFSKLVVKILEHHNEHIVRSSSYNWTYYASLYFSASVVTTVGYGHMAPSTFGGRLFCIFYAIFGIPLCVLTLKSIGDRINELLEDLFIMIGKKHQLRQTQNMKIKVMLSTSGLVMIFLSLGGLLYLTEGWTYFDGVYYTFIALSTIGFGDMVPKNGREPTSPIETLELIIRGFYIILGLALVSSLLSAIVAAKEVFPSWNVYRRTRASICCRQQSNDLTDDVAPRYDGPYSISRSLDNMVFPSVIPYRAFGADDSVPLVNDPRWLY